MGSARNNYDGTSGIELSGRKMAFYGYGAVARAVGKLATGFGMELYAYDPYIPKDAIKSMGAEPVDNVEDLFKYQYVSLHVPLTAETKESINKALVGDKFMKRVIFTKKKMGAQTLEANNNAGVAAANQIVGFFEKGITKFQVKE